MIRRIRSLLLVVAVWLALMGAFASTGCSASPGEYHLTFECVGFGFLADCKQPTAFDITIE